MLIGLAGGALWALDTVILGMALALPVFTGDPRAAILAPFASTFLHDLCSFLWMLGYTGLRRQYKAVWQALHTRGGRFVALGKLGTGKAMPLNITYAAWSLPFSYLLLHQVPGTKDILCALVVLLGALLAAYEKPQKLEKSNNQ